VPSASPAEARRWLDGERDKWKAITQEVKIDVPQ
jgi:hypothetical protein